MPVVSLGERSTEPGADVVRTDDSTGLALVVDHLIGLGHREIAYAGGHGGPAGADRAAMYRFAMAAQGLSELVEEISVGFSEEDGASAAHTLMARDRLPTAVIDAATTAGRGCSPLSPGWASRRRA